MTTARAMAVRCFCPPESVTPRSPIIVSYRAGKSSTSLLSCETSPAHSVWASVSARSTPNPTFSRSGTENRKVSWGT